MTGNIVVVDHRLESLVLERNLAGTSWVLARDEGEIRELMRIGSIRKVLVHKRFRFESGKRLSPSIPPIVLVFDRKENPPSFQRILPLMPFLDMIISGEDLESRLEEVVSSPPFFSTLSFSWFSYLPEEVRGICRFYHRLKILRREIAPRQWEILRLWAEQGGEIDRVARILEQNPKTVRNGLKKISGYLGVDHIDRFSRDSAMEFIRLVSYEEPWQKEQ